MVCGSNENDRPKHIQKASVPAKVLPHSIATHSLVAQIMYQKFGMGLPFARQEKDFYRMGLVLSRANAVLYTLVETARANDLNVYAYLDYLLAEMPNADFYNQPEIRAE